ncbi:MAG: transposase [Rhodospirillales bacterium]|nr:transposase [Rhodospirillales bacterium]
MADTRETAEGNGTQLVEIPGGPSPTSRFLADEHWAALERVLPPPDGNNLGKAEADRREFVEALLWMAYHGCGWSGLPAPRWNADSMRRKRQRWRNRGWLELLLHAAPTTDLPDWLVPITLVAFDPGHVPQSMSGGTWETDANTVSDGGVGTSHRTSAHVRPDMSHVRPHVRHLSAPMSGREGAGHDAGHGADKDTEHGGPTVTFDRSSMEELARLIGEAVGAASGGRAGRARGRSELAVVWGDVPSWAKGGFAVVIALFTSVLMAPAYLHGMSPFAGDLRDSFNLPMWAATLVVVFGPPIFVMLVLWVVYWMVQREQARERARLERTGGDTGMYG